MTVRALVDTAVIASVVGALVIPPRTAMRRRDPARKKGCTVPPAVLLALVTGPWST
ncbi:hypothetical protein HW130_31320 [Streptomyces sp. PKU-EA00015]|uniref:hypothetical protein n=1 Tax=Streptomyces sp. PKU-EA00015 TaxID=2748326 RepID=UPI0015A3EB61|nr:hypothetical protein [Streptomyces sp. PKU-EA00015]NWF30686.1 hypothetical protein [Streptomyces sp. PKU-EA00015]